MNHGHDHGHRHNHHNNNNAIYERNLRTAYIRFRNFILQDPNYQQNPVARTIIADLDTYIPDDEETMEIKRAQIAYWKGDLGEKCRRHRHSPWEYEIYRPLYDHILELDAAANSVPRRALQMGGWPDTLP